jgi:chorismate lyase/3-hydroxybenzoate synthase
MKQIMFKEGNSYEECLRKSEFAGNYSDSIEKSASNIYIPSLCKFNFEFFQEPNGKPVSKRIIADFEISESEDYLVARIQYFEDDQNSLEDLGYKAYKEIFNLIEETKLSFVRAWNYIPDILDENNNIERYRQFNIGRWNAWQDYGPKYNDGTPIRPAATGIGSFGGPLIIEVLLSKFPVSYIENPRQKQFVHYSEKWGPKPPVSARGTLLHSPQGDVIYIAGTASLVGEEVAHENDIKKQTIETLKNIEVLISNENLKNYNSEGRELKEVGSIRVYVKNPNDLEIIISVLDTIWKDKEILYLHDDICRPGFLIEIEGVVYPK